MKVLNLNALLMATALATVPALGQTPTCPAAGSATGCNTTIVINPGGTLTIAAGPGVTPYDGSDDDLVGILNNSGATVNAIALSGSGSAGGIFSFDGDGVDSYLTPAISPNPMDASSGGYGGPLSYFTNISAAQDSGMVNFIGGLASGAQTFFSLENSLGQAVITPGGPSVTPEPGTLLLLGTGVLGLAGQIKRRFLA